MKKVLSILLVIMMLVAVAGCSGSASAPEENGTESPTEPQAPEEPVALKAALLTSGPVNDGGWNTKAYEGLMVLQDEYGFEVAFTENIKQDDQAQMAREYARKGFDLIIGHGFEFGDPLTAVASEFPDTYFLNVGGISGGVEPNLASGVFENGVLGYLAGQLAGEMTETNRIGFVGAMEIPTVLAEVEAIVATAKYYNPAAEVTVAYTGSWVDIAAGKEAALAQIAGGADFLIAIGDACNAGVIQAAEENDVWAFGWAGDMNHLAPEHVVTSGVQSVAKVMEVYAQMLIDGNWDNSAATFGIAQGTQFLGKWAPGVPEDIKNKVEQDYDKFVKGEYSRQIVAEMVGI